MLKIFTLCSYIAFNSVDVLSNIYADQIIILEFSRHSCVSFRSFSMFPRDTVYGHLQKYFITWSVVKHCFHQHLVSQHYLFRKMYWGGRGVSLKIEQANMDGSARTTLVSSGLTWVNSVAMDYQSRLLYWCDGYLDKIERVDLQGNNRVVILDLSSDSMHPFGLALFGDIIFWSDWNSQSIHKFNMTASVDEVVVQGMGRPMELHVYDKSKLFTG